MVLDDRLHISLFASEPDFVTPIGTQSPTHLKTGIGRIKLGRVLLRQRRFAEAEPDSLADYRILAGQTTPSVSWLQSARSDLGEIHDALGNRAEADKYRAELEAARR